MNYHMAEFCKGDVELLAEDIERIRQTTETVIKAYTTISKGYLQGLASIALAIAYIFYISEKHARYDDQILGLRDNFCRAIYSEEAVFSVFYGILEVNGHGKLFDNSFSLINKICDNIFLRIKKMDEKMFIKLFPDSVRFD